MHFYKRKINGDTFRFKTFDCKRLYLYVVEVRTVEFIILQKDGLFRIISDVPNWIKDLEDDLYEASEGME
jgi:hypothetical protein